MADAVFESFLIHTATIKRNSSAVGAQKKPTEAYAVLAGAVKCRVKPVKADSKQMVGGMVTDSDHKGYFLPDQDLRETDHVIVAGVTYEVRGVERPVDNAAVHHVTAHLKKKAV